MINSDNSRYTYTLRVKPRLSLFQSFDIDQPSTNEVNQSKLQNHVNSDNSRVSRSSFDESMKSLIDRVDQEMQSLEHSEKPVHEDGLENLKQREKHMKLEMTRMEHYTTRIKNEILSIKSDIEYIQDENKIHQNGTQSINRTEKLEDLYHQLTKRKLRLIEHLKEVNKRRVTLEKHRAKIIECENNNKTLRNRIHQEDKYTSNGKHHRTDTIERHQSYESLLKDRFKEPIKNEIKLLSQHTERIRSEIQLLKNGYESIKTLTPSYLNIPKQRPDNRAKFDIFNWDQMAQQYEQLKQSDKSISTPNIQQRISDDHQNKIQKREQIYFNPAAYNYNDSCVVLNQAKYDFILSFINQNHSTIERIKNALPEWYSIHMKDTHSTTNIKICLDNSSTAVIAVINNEYELSTTCQADITHTFKRQFPLVLIILDPDYKPSTNWMTIVWQAPKTQKVLFNHPNFEENLQNAITDAQWNLSPNSNISKIFPAIMYDRSKRFLGDHHEWTAAYQDPASVSHKYRQLISDPLRIATNIKLQDIYYNYIRNYFENSPDVMKLFEKGVYENDIREFILAYTHTGPLSMTLNRHLASNILFYFGPTLHNNVDYQLVKSLIDFAALCIYRLELRSYLFTGTVYRSVVMSETDLSEFIIGSRIMNTTFLSTSKEKRVGEFFPGKNQKEFIIVCTYLISNKRNRRTALDIGCLSYFPDEQEVLILPFSAFRVKNVIRSPDKPKSIEMILVEDDFHSSKKIDVKLLTIRI